MRARNFLLVSALAVMHSLAQATPVYTYNPLDQPPCERLDDVNSVVDAIAQLRRRLGPRLLVLSEPFRIEAKSDNKGDTGRTMAIVELPDKRGPQAVMLMEGSRGECEKASRASLVGPGAVPGTGDSKANWVRFAGNDSGRETVYVDVNSVYPEPSGLIRLWVKQTYRDPQARRTGLTPYRSAVSGQVLNCSAGAVAMVAAELYDAEGRRVGQRSVLRAQWQFERAEPESLEALLLNAHCGRIKP